MFFQDNPLGPSPSSQVPWPVPCPLILPLRSPSPAPACGHVTISTIRRRSTYSQNEPISMHYTKHTQSNTNNAFISDHFSCTSQWHRFVPTTSRCRVLRRMCCCMLLPRLETLCAAGRLNLLALQLFNLLQLRCAQNICRLDSFIGTQSMCCTLLQQIATF